MSVTIKFTDSMHALLDWFEGQPCSCATIGHMNDEIDYSRETIRQNLQLLCAAGHAEVRHEPTGEYRLIEDPRDEDLRGDGAGAGTIVPEVDPIDALLEDVVDDEEDPYAEANQLAVELVRRSEDRLRAGELQAAVADELPEEIKPASWWEDHGRPAIKAAGAEVQKPKGWTIDE